MTATRQELEDEGYCCACHLNPPCDYCTAPVRCNDEEGLCETLSDDWVEHDDTDTWLCEMHERIKACLRCNGSGAIADVEGAPIDCDCAEVPPRATPPNGHGRGERCGGT